MTGRTNSALQPPIVPKNGHTVRVIVPCRVSDPKPGKQDERSLDDQRAMHEEWLKANLDHPFEMIALEGRESGEWIERSDYLELMRLVETDEFDLVRTEDLGRIVRRIHAHLFAELCVDYDTRLIAQNDHVDTAIAGWEDRSIFSAWHHERSNRDTSDRIKRTAANRFRSGGCAAFEIAGYIKPPGAKSDLDWRKDPDWEPIYKEWFRMLDEDQASYAEIADWLNANSVATGPFCRSDSWDGPMVGRYTHHIMLKGYRFRNRRKTRRNSKGKYVSEKASDDDLILRHVPHLAFFEEEYYDRVVSDVDERNAIYRRNSRPNGKDCRSRIPKNRTRFPGQSLTCGICGRGYVFGGHGQKDHLMCTGAREYKCWNGVTADGPLTARMISAVVLAEIQTLPAFDETFLSLVNAEAEKADEHRQARINELDRRRQQLDREIDNLMRFIRNGDSSDRVRLELRQLEEQAQRINADLHLLTSTPSEAVDIPPASEIGQLIDEALNSLDVESWDFCRVMQKLVPRIVVYPVRLCDGGNLVLRAECQVDLSGMLPDTRVRAALQDPLTQAVTVDLFVPPQREKYRERVVELSRTVSFKDAAALLGITSTAAQRASKLQKRMDELGIRDPYVRIKSPPEDVRRLRRHKHPRYCFQPNPIPSATQT